MLKPENKYFNMLITRNRHDLTVQTLCHGHTSIDDARDCALHWRSDIEKDMRRHHKQLREYKFIIVRGEFTELETVELSV